MKKLLLLSLVVLLFSCNGADDPKLCLEQVKKTFPNSTIYSKSSFVFYVSDSNGVKEVSTLNLSNPEISNIKFLQKQ